MDFISHSDKETEKFAQKIAGKIKPGDILALYGDLGSGKTTFTRFLAQALGVEGNITSPTFVIEKRYKIKRKAKSHAYRQVSEKRKARELIHIDCYRMDEGNIDQDYLKELFKDEESVKVIEWSEKIEKYLPKNSKKISFEYIGERERKIKY